MIREDRLIETAAGMGKVMEDLLKEQVGSLPSVDDIRGKVSFEL